MASNLRAGIFGERHGRDDGSCRDGWLYAKRADIDAASGTVESLCFLEDWCMLPKFLSNLVGIQGGQNQSGQR